MCCRRSNANEGFVKPIIEARDGKRLFALKPRQTGGGWLPSLVQIGACSTAPERRCDRCSWKTARIDQLRASGFDQSSTCHRRVLEGPTTSSSMCWMRSSRRRSCLRRSPRRQQRQRQQQRRRPTRRAACRCPRPRLCRRLESRPPRRTGSPTRRKASPGSLWWMPSSLARARPLKNRVSAGP